MREKLVRGLRRPRLWVAAAAALVLAAALALGVWRLGADTGVLPPGSSVASGAGVAVAAVSTTGMASPSPSAGSAPAAPTPESVSAADNR